MEKTANYFLVGVFVSSMLLGVFLFLIWLASPHDRRNYEFYTLKFRSSISGLEEGAEVQYKGVKVGKVVRFRLDPKNSELVYVDVGVDRTTPIRSQTKAVLETQGITGLVRIELATKQDDTAPAVARDGQPYPVLDGEPSKLFQALEDLPDITNKLVDITKKFDQFLDEETVEGLKKTVKNAEKMSRDLNGLLSEENVAHASHVMDKLSESSDKVPELIERLRKTADQMDQASTTLNGILSRNKAHINAFASEGLGQITAVSREAKGTAQSLRGLADKLKSDPSQILYQPSSHGVEIPQ